MLVLDAGGGPSRLQRIILELKADENFEPARPPCPSQPHAHPTASHNPAMHNSQAK